jgi:hypothetical protein
MLTYFLKLRIQILEVETFWYENMSPTIPDDKYFTNIENNMNCQSPP